MSGDAGVATVWAAALLAVLATVLIGGLRLGGAVLARHRAESAADLAALAAADRATAGEVAACRAAATAATAAGSDVVTCRLVGWDALVEVRVGIAPGLPGVDHAVGRARAGPAPDPPPGGTSTAPPGAPPDVRATGGARRGAAPRPNAPAEPGERRVDRRFSGDERSPPPSGRPTS